MREKSDFTADYTTVSHLSPHIIWLKSAIRETLPATLAFLAALGLLEMVARWASFRPTYHYHEVENVYWEDQNTLLLYLPDPEVFWRLRPGIRMKATVAGRVDWARPDPPRRYTWEIGVSPKGFRGPDFPRSKPPGELRVACFGDSRTLGEGLDEGETYPKRLAQLLEERFPGRSIRVINLGQDGWSSHQGVRLLESEVVDFSPDVAVFAFGVNDADTDWGVSDEVRASSIDRRKVAAQSVLYRSLLFYWAGKELQEARAHLFGKTRATRRWEGRWKPARARVSPADYDRNVRAFIRGCRRRGIVPVVLSLPVNPYSDWTEWMPEEANARERYRQAFSAGAALRDRERLEEAHSEFQRAASFSVFARYEAIADKAARDEFVTSVSLDGPFREVLPWEPLYLDEVHLNPRGAALAAEFLAETIARLPPPPPESVMASLEPSRKRASLLASSTAQVPIARP
jgi:lysophospholipase L1-like esterase